MNLKRISLIAMSAFCALSVSAQTDFRHINLNEALAAAKKEKKLVFVDFYTDWCGPCKKMASQTFPDKTLGDFMNKKFVCIKLNAEKEGAADAKRLGVTAYPTFYVLDANGTKNCEIKGYMDAETFLSKISAGIDPKMSLKAMEERYNKGERTPELVNAWALHYMEQGKEKEGFAIIKEYYESLKEKQLLKPENAFLFTRYTMTVTEPMGAFMVTHRNDFDASVRPAIMKRIQALYHSDVNTYFSGYRWSQKKFVQADYQALKAKIIELGLDKDYNYASVFRLIETRVATADDAGFFNACKEEYDRLAPSDQTLLMLNLTRLITTDDPVVLKDISSFIRKRLEKMDANSIVLCARILGSIEEKIKK